MKKYAVSIVSVSLMVLSGRVFAMPGSEAISSVVARTDAQMAALVSSAAELPQIEAPAPVRSDARAVQLTDITDKCTDNGEVKTSYPLFYAQVPKEENALILKVYSFTGRDGAERRIEVLFTGGDWMQYGLVYFITNAGADRNKVSAYFMTQLSTPDKQDGDVAPAVDPHDTQKLVSFITSEFLTQDGNLKTGYTSVVSAPAK
jgi:hypothetical protein